jgi:diguanylate cyclase (GGDEF)-like protein
MNQIDIILHRLKENEEIHRKFHELELKIISILNFKDFFEILLTEMKNIFGVSYVWLSVIEESILALLINRLNDSEIIRHQSNFIQRSDFNKRIGRIRAPLLLNTDLEAYSVFFPKGNVYPIQSIAISPVQIDGEIVGSLNQGDASPNRFEPDMDVSLLEQLMLKVSICLSNVAAHEKLQYFAYHDVLTGVLNRRALEEELHREFSRSRRYSEILSIVFLDLDAFKEINDQYGHDTGDYVLRYVARTLQSLSRKEDPVARFAGDEFVVILPETRAETSEFFINRVQHYLENHPLTINKTIFKISLSYGIASTAEADITNSEQLLKKADERLYIAKKSYSKKSVNIKTF